MSDVLVDTVGGFQRDIAAADWATRTFFTGVPEALVPSKLLAAALRIRPDVLSARADQIHVLARVYADNMAAQSRQKYDLLQDAWAGQGAQHFGYLWERVDAHLRTLAEKATQHAQRAAEVADRLNDLRSACATAVVANLKGMHETANEYADAISVTFSDLWNGIAGDPAALASALTDGVAGFWKGVMTAASWKADVYGDTIEVARAVDAIPIIDSNQFAATAAPDVADFVDYTRGWRPEPVDGKPWDSA
ncbi:hypothetical protein GCM10022255_065050 [Dactylosporangium darangshiense]|uniref:PPE family domain-containing protein n=1 Tax=Dactylosporangium darangshiense TaxID=579108 RepID=A0ABP8DGY0_9ACTN